MLPLVGSKTRLLKIYGILDLKISYSPLFVPAKNREVALNKAKSL